MHHRLYLFCVLPLTLTISVAISRAQTQTPQQQQHGAAATPASQTKTNSPPRRGLAGGGDYPDYDPVAVERGQKVFVSNCSFCHGANAKGGESGPDLLRSVVVLDDENGDKIGQVVLNGRPDKGMPKFELSQAQILDIATFLHERVKAAALRGTYQILNIVVGNPQQGETYFNGPGKCSTCHSVTGDLAHVGSKYDPVDLQQHIVMSREGRRRGNTTAVNPSASAVTASILLPSGQTVSGTLEHIDDFNVAIQDSNGDYRSFSRNEDSPQVTIHDPLQAHTDLLAHYTDSDIHNLTAYLLTVK